MPETIRDVTIKIGLELKQSNLKVPDISSGVSSVADQVQKVEAATTAADSAFEKLGETAKEATSGMSEQVTSLDAKIAALDAELESLNKSFDEQDKAAEKAAETLASFPANIATDFQQLGVNVMRTARGFALLAGGDVTELVKTFAKFQAGIDIISGLPGVIGSVTKAYRTLKTAQAAAAAGNAALAVSMISTTAAASPLAVAIGAILLPLLPLIAAAGAAAAALAFLYRTIRKESGDLPASTEELEEYQRIVDSIQKPKFQASSSGRLQDAAGDFADLEKQVTLTKQAIQDLQDLPRIGIANPKEGPDLERARLEIAERELAINDELAARQKELGALKLAQNEAQRQLLEGKEHELALARELAQREAERELSFRAQLGLLTKFEESQARRLALKVQEQGIESLSLEQLKLFQRFAGSIGQDATRQEAARRSGDLGDVIAGAIGVDLNRNRGALAGVESDIRGITGAGPDVTANQAINNQLAELNQADQKVKSELFEVIKDLTTHTETLEQNIHNIRTRVQALIDNQGVRPEAVAGGL